MNPLTNNIRWLLWQQNKDVTKRGEWSVMLARWIRDDEARAREVLRGDGRALTPNELTGIVSSTGEDDQMIASGQLYEDSLVLLENIRFLIKTSGHGIQKKLAEELTKDKSTITRWMKVDVAPRLTQEELGTICRVCGVGPHVDLRAEPIFLEPEPVSPDQKRDWLIERVRRINVETLVELFPALKKLLEEQRGDH